MYQTCVYWTFNYICMYIHMYVHTVTFLQISAGGLPLMTCTHAEIRTSWISPPSPPRVCGLLALHAINNSIQFLLSVAVPLEELTRFRVKDKFRTIFRRVLCIIRTYRCVYCTKVEWGRMCGLVASVLCHKDLRYIAFTAFIMHTQSVELAPV